MTIPVHLPSACPTSPMSLREYPLAQLTAPRRSSTPAASPGWRRYSTTISAELGRFDPVAPDDLPHDYRTLLAHNDHMTVTLEAFHGCLVNVRVLAEWRDEASYARNSLLVSPS